MCLDAKNGSSALLPMAGLVMVNVFWAASSIAAKQALHQLSAIEIITIRFSIAFFIILALTLLIKGPGSLRIDLKDVPVFILLSVVSVSLGFFLQIEAIAQTTVTNFSIEFNMSTFFIMILGAVLLRERLTRKKLLGSAVAFGGAILIISGGSLNFSSGHLAGDLIGLASAVSFGIFTIASKKISEKYGIMTILTYTFLFGVLQLLPFYALGPHETPLAGLSVLSWSSMLFLGIFCSVFCFLVYTYGLKKLRASDVAMSIYVNPLAGILLAILLMGEALTIFTIAGGALVLAGMFMTQGELKAEPKMGRPQEGAKHYTAYNE